MLTTIDLPGTQSGWFNTGISVWPGETVQYTASGTIRFGVNGWPRDPSGRDEKGNVESPARQYDNAFGAHPAGDQVKNSLVFRVGNTVFQGGPHGSFQCNIGGALFVSNNDNFVNDNSGSWRIDVTIPRAVKTVRTAYIVPKDRQYNPTYLNAIQHALEVVRRWYRTQVFGPGKVPRTFVYDPVVVFGTPIESGWFSTNFYWNTVHAAKALVGCRENDPHLRWVLYVDAPGGGQALNGILTLPTQGLGTTPTPTSNPIGGLAHEMGHIFGLDDLYNKPALPERDRNDSIMGNGMYKFNEAVLPGIPFVSGFQLPTLMSSPFFHPAP